jgi:hypothetical protein
MATFLVGQYGPGVKKVRLWPEMRQMLADLWERNKHWWYPEEILTQLAGHFRWALQKVLSDPCVEDDWNAMLVAVWAKSSSIEALPAPEVSRAAMRAFLTGWVSFMNKNQLQRMGITTKKYGATGFMAGLNQKKKADEEDKGRGAKGSGDGRTRNTRSGGARDGGTDEGARGALTLTFVTTRTATRWFGLDLVWVSKDGGQVEVSTVNADRMRIVGWRCTTEKHKDKYLQPSDALVKVNGAPVDDDSLEAASAFLDKARHRFPITIEVRRNTNKRYSTTRGAPIESEFWCADEGPRRAAVAHKITWLGDGDDDVGLGCEDSDVGSEESDLEGQADGTGEDGGRRDGSRKRARGPSRPAPSRSKGGPPRGYILFGEVSITVVSRFFYKCLGSTRVLEPGTVLTLEPTPSTAFPNAVHVRGPHGSVGNLPEGPHLVLVSKLLTDLKSHVHCRAVVHGKDVRHDSLDAAIEVRHW